MVWLAKARAGAIGAVIAAGLLAASGGCGRQPESLESVGERAESPSSGAEAGAPRHALVGQEAPRFTAERLGGSSVELEDHVGDVVMLDFWATWCPPCVDALPKVARVASEFSGEGVAFYAVNVGEDAEAVEEFLRQQELDVPVLMDRESDVAGAYQASGIPQTVLIGRDGTVQAVHVGLSADLETTLRQQLNALVDGEHLAES